MRRGLFCLPCLLVTFSFSVTGSKLGLESIHVNPGKNNSNNNDDEDYNGIAREKNQQMNKQTDTDDSKFNKNLTATGFDRIRTF